MAAPRYQPFKRVWEYFNWHAFFLRKERVYDRLYSVTACTLVGLIIYQGVSVFTSWNATLQQTYQHYLKKEKTRKDLAELIRLAREEGVLPPASPPPEAA